MSRATRSNAPDRLDELHKICLAAIAAGTWPEHSVDVWRALAADARRRRSAGEALSVTDRRALEVDQAVRDAAP